jgi:hypothetical protein
MVVLFAASVEVADFMLYPNYINNEMLMKQIYV